MRWKQCLTKKMMTMKNKQQLAIKSLEDLRREKRRLRLEMKASEDKHDYSCVNKAVNLVSSIKNDSSFTSSKVEDALQWVGDKASEKYPMKGFTKILISGLILVAVPIITTKLQEYIDDKL